MRHGCSGTCASRLHATNEGWHVWVWAQSALCVSSNSVVIKCRCRRILRAAPRRGSKVPQRDVRISISHPTQKRHQDMTNVGSSASAIIWLCRVLRATREAALCRFAQSGALCREQCVATKSQTNRVFGQKILLESLRDSVGRRRKGHDSRACFAQNTGKTSRLTCNRTC